MFSPDWRTTSVRNAPISVTRSSFRFSSAAIVEVAASFSASSAVIVEVAVSRSASSAVPRPESVHVCDGLLDLRLLGLDCLGALLVRLRQCIELSLAFGKERLASFDALLLFQQETAHRERRHGRANRDLGRGVLLPGRGGDCRGGSGNRHLIAVRDQQLTEDLMPEVPVQERDSAKQARDGEDGALSHRLLPYPPSRRPFLVGARPRRAPNRPMTVTTAFRTIAETSKAAIPSSRGTAVAGTSVRRLKSLKNESANRLRSDSLCCRRRSEFHRT